MPSVTEVRPKKWNEETIIDLYDDGCYSAIWGVESDATQGSLGVRWNGKDKSQGYPNQGKNPLWYSEPDFLTVSILHALLSSLVSSKEIKRRDEFIQNILIALSDCSMRHNVFQSLV